MLGRRVKLLRLLTRRWTFSGLGAAGSSPGHVASCSESGCSCRGSVQRWLLLRDLVSPLPTPQPDPKILPCGPVLTFSPHGLRCVSSAPGTRHDTIYQGPWRWVQVFLTAFWGVFQVPPCSCSTRSRCSFTQRELHGAARQPGCGVGRGSDRTAVRDFHFLQTDGRHTDRLYWNASSREQNSCRKDCGGRCSHRQGAASGISKPCVWTTQGDTWRTNIVVLWQPCVFTRSTQQNVVLGVPSPVFGAQAS